MKPRIMASSAETSMTPSRMMSRSVIGMIEFGLSDTSGALPVEFGDTGPYQPPRVRRRPQAPAGESPQLIDFPP